MPNDTNILGSNNWSNIVYGTIVIEAYFIMKIPLILSHSRSYIDVLLNVLIPKMRV